MGNPMLFIEKDGYVHQAFLTEEQKFILETTTRLISQKAPIRINDEPVAKLQSKNK